MSQFKTLEVVTAATDTKLTTVDRLKTDLGLTEETDAFLGTVIDVASAEISTYLNQGVDDEAKSSIARQTIQETRFGVSGMRTVYLSRFPIGDIVSIQENNTVTPRQITGADGAMTAASGLLTSEGAAFTDAIVGKTVTVTGAGALGADLVTTVASVTDGTNIVLSDVAGTTVAAAAYAIDNPSFLYKLHKGTGALTKYIGNSVTPFLVDQIIVKYTSGWILPGQTGANLPEDLQGACVLHCTQRLEQNRNADSDMARIRSEEIEGVGRVEYAIAARDFKSSMTGEVRAILDAWRIEGFY